MNLVSISPDAPFLDVVAEKWLGRFGTGENRGLILLPTRRAARALAETFLRATGGKPMLLPRITALGALDEAPLALAGALDLPPAIAPLYRLAALAKLILALPEAQGGVRAADRAWMLAVELAALMDEAERAEVPLRDALARAAEEQHAAHWQVTLQFLGIVTEHWPAHLEAHGVMNPAARQAALLAAQAKAWTADAPDSPVWAAGMTGATPAVARLLRAVAHLPQGLVVLPGLDHDLPDETWQSLDEAHPQSGLRRLLADLDATRGDVTAWSSPSPRARTLARALLPATALQSWRDPFEPELGNLFRLDAGDQQAEAGAIALILRDALETPGARAALVTPDRMLAGRVAAELLRWGVVADDSAGEKLSETPPAVFLRLLAAAIDFSPVALLALLKHPLAAAGLSPAACRDAARAFERARLRGPKPPPGLPGLRRAAGGDAVAADLVERLEAALAPLLRITQSVAAAPADVLAALIESAEALAATDKIPGPARLWSMEEGEALAAHLTEALAALRTLPDQPPRYLAGLLDVLLEGEVVRSRRALRGREDAAEHPRVFIWGLLEARLQHVDVVVLGGLVEGVWPPATDPGPWLSRPMRTRAGLPSPEDRIGQAAHDFLSVCSAAKVAVLSHPRRRDGAPTVPARWLTRLDAMLAGMNARIAAHPASAWAAALDQPARAAVGVAPPRPCPPLASRPRKLSVTEVQTWLEDPYAIYARHVLRLEALKPLEEETDAADYGSLVHNGMQIFLAETGVRWPANGADRLRAAMDRALQEAGLRQALAAWWAPRLRRIADWVAEQEVERRSRFRPVDIRSEVTGVWDLPELRFSLRGRADRIEQRADGRLSIVDYKTGVPPSAADVAAGFAPQLPLEAAMARAGAFEGFRGETVELSYWRLTGGFDAGKVTPLFKGDAAVIADAVETADAKLRELIAAYDEPARAYLSQPHAGRSPRFSKYAQLARVAEWDLGDDQ